MAFTCDGLPHQSSGPFLGRALRDAPISTTHLINYSLGIKGNPSPSDARGCDLSDERGALGGPRLGAISHTGPGGGHRDDSDRPVYNISVVMVVMVRMVLVVVMDEAMVPKGAVTPMTRRVPIPVILCVDRPVAVREPCSAAGTAL